MAKRKACELSESILKKKLWPGGSKAATQGGLKASQIAMKYFETSSGNFVKVDIEFDANDRVTIFCDLQGGIHSMLSLLSREKIFGD